MGTIFVLWGGNFTDRLQGVDIPADKKLSEEGDFQKIVQEDFFGRDLARNAQIHKFDISSFD